jgi:nucleoid DNA-binding protein
MNHATWALLALVSILITAGAQVLGTRKLPPTFQDGVAVRVKQEAKTVDEILKAFGPAVVEQLLAGRSVDLPGIATIRVVRVKEYTDLVGGIVTRIPARNYIEVVPTAELDRVANLPGTVPAPVVEPYEFKVNPDTVPGIRTDGIKTPRTRIGR